MKWFKHLSQSHTDEKLADLLSECGLEGYGFWWLLMEVVAEQCTDDKCSATYTLPHWSRLLYSHHNKVSKYLGKLGVIGIVTVEYIESKVMVTIPNLLKYRDEYSRKSGQKPDKLPPKKEKEKEKENKEGKDLSASGDAAPKNDFLISKRKRKLEGKRLETFLMFWDAFDYKKGRAEAIDTWLDIPLLTVALVDEIVSAAKKEAESRPAMIQSGKTPKMAQGWLSGRRWEDEPEKPLASVTPILNAMGTPEQLAMVQRLKERQNATA